MHKSFSDPSLTVAVLGSSGAVGVEMLKILEERSFPIKELRLLASERSAGKTQVWKGKELLIEKVTPKKFENVDLVLASAGGSVSRQWRPIINSLGEVMVDNSSYCFFSQLQRAASSFVCIIESI